MLCAASYHTALSSDKRCLKQHHCSAGAWMCMSRDQQLLLVWLGLLWGPGLAPVLLEQLFRLLAALCLVSLSSCFSRRSLSACHFPVPKSGPEERWRLCRLHRPAHQGGNREEIHVVPSEIINSLCGRGMVLSNDL